jgi:hypothetical protein
MKTYTGGCHCGAVRYEVEMEVDSALVCNCSHCAKKGFMLFAVDKEKFKLLRGTESQTLYQFGKKSIRHLFCAVCGVQSYAEGETFPKMMVNLRCVDDLDLKTLPVTEYNGKDV